MTAALDALIDEAGGPAWDEAGFARLRDHVAGHLAERTSEIVGRVVRVLDAAREVERRLEPLTAVPLQPARADVREQLRRLVYPGLRRHRAASRTSSATCRAPRAGSSGSRTTRPSTATA